MLDSGFFVITFACVSVATAAPEIIVRNNHDLPYSGPVVFKTDLPDGTYGTVSVEKGIARVDVVLNVKSMLMTVRSVPGTRITKRLPSRATAHLANDMKFSLRPTLDMVLG